MIGDIKKYCLLLVILISAIGCSDKGNRQVMLVHGPDVSSGGGDSYIISTTNATYYLDKIGGGLSSMLDTDGIDWLGFHNAKGSGHKGEYRGFPNAIHKQDGSYFHAMNAGTDPSSSTIEIESAEHIQISFITENKQWEGLWNFYPERCDFTMTKISSGYKYWVQYEGVPGGEMDSTDYWIASSDSKKHNIHESFLGDLPKTEWMAFGDATKPRVLYLAHHDDDDFPDNYVSRPDMTVLGFGRKNKDKYLTTPQTFSIGFIESTDYNNINETIQDAVSIKK